MTTARSIITRSLRKIGALMIGEGLSAEEAADGLDSLNALLSSWSNDSLCVYARTLESFPLTGASSYTIGSGGDFNTVKPTSIVYAYARSGTTDYPIGIVTDEAFASIATKTTSGLPFFLNYNNADPLGVIKLYPVGLSSYTLYLMTEKPLTSLSSLDADIVLPEGWERAIIYNLAMELAPEYGQQPDASIVSIARESLGLIRTKVAQVRRIDAYPQNLGIQNIYTGWYS